MTKEELKSTKAKKKNSIGDSAAEMSHTAQFLGDEKTNIKGRTKPSGSASSTGGGTSPTSPLHSSGPKLIGAIATAENKSDDSEYRRLNNLKTLFDKYEKELSQMRAVFKGREDEDSVLYRFLKAQNHDPDSAIKKLEATLVSFSPYK
jgi:hypothetical protein